MVSTKPGFMKWDEKCILHHWIHCYHDVEVFKSKEEAVEYVHKMMANYSETSNDVVFLCKYSTEKEIKWKNTLKKHHWKEDASPPSSSFWLFPILCRFCWFGSPYLSCHVGSLCQTYLSDTHSYHNIIKMTFILDMKSLDMSMRLPTTELTWSRLRHRFQILW